MSSDFGVPRLARHVSFLISQIASVSTTAFEVRVALQDLTPREFGILSALADREGQSQSELSDRLGMHRNAMVEVVDSLEAKSLVARTRHPNDRRAFAIVLTDQGRERIPALDGVVLDLDSWLTSELSSGDRDKLLLLLSQVAETCQLAPGVHPTLSDPATSAPS